MKAIFTKTIATFAIALTGLSVLAQTDSKKTDSTNLSAFKRAITFNALLQTRWMASVTNHVDVTGKNYDATTTNPVNNNFSIRRARLMVKAAVNDRLSTNFMVNFAEFNGNTANRVVENAFIKYAHNKHFNVQAGQFRPFFGLEDLIPAEMVRTFDYTNQYNTFAANGWQGFQIGVSAFGMINKDDDHPINYYAGVYNGNNRNQAIDDDNTKNIYARIDAKPYKFLTVGINAARGSNAARVGDAFSADFSSTLDLTANKTWQLLLSGQYLNGTNFITCTNAPVTAKPAQRDCKMQGFYFFPLVRYACNKPRLRAIEFSPRYEYFDEDYKLNSNVHQTVIPNLTFVFADDYFASLQIGTTIDVYKNEKPLSSTYNHDLFYAQLQLRF